MKPLFEIAQTLNLLRGSRRGNVFAPVEIQVLEYACEKIKEHPTSAEFRIRKRIAKLEEIQGKKEFMGFATKRARAAQIKALKWVVDEGEIE